MFHVLCVILLSLNLYPSSKTPKPPEIPDRFEDILMPDVVGSPITAGQRAQIMKWVHEKPMNKNGVMGNESLLQIVLANQKDAVPGYAVFTQELLETKPDVLFRDVSKHSELQKLCLPNNPISKEHEALQIIVAKQIIHLMIEQGASYQAIEKELAAINPDQPKIKDEALAHVRGLRDAEHNRKTAEIAEKELNKYLLPVLAPIATEYISPPNQKGATKVAPSGKSAAK